MVKKFIRKFLPQEVENYLRNMRAFSQYIPHYLYDLNRYVKYSIKNTYPKDSYTQINARIITLYHVIEKGLTMPSPRIGFGVERIKELIKLLIIYKENFPTACNSQYNIALEVLESYVEFHKNTDVDTLYIAEFLQSLDNCNLSHGGYFTINKEEINQKSTGNFVDLVDSRHSYRNFSNENVPDNDIIEAIKLAQKSPSSCNRQSTRVYIIKDEKKIQEVLTLQRGANGFQHKINKLIMLTYDIESYQGDGDRMSGYVDSGLFGMTLLYALTFKGIGSIALNWSKGKANDIALRKLINIKESHNVVFFIGLGMLNEYTKIAASSRFHIDEILINEI